MWSYTLLLASWLFCENSVVLAPIVLNFEIVLFYTCTHLL
jgi:hypothetical protein